MRDPIHPGEILKAEFLDELGVSPYALAKALRVPPNRITGIVNGERAISADTALRLAACFGTSPEFWINLQTHYDLEMAKRDAGTKIAQQVAAVA
jgi:addiction module HigA family antidote